MSDMFNDELFDFEFDFDAVNIPDGVYIASVESVTFRQGPNSKDPSKITTMLFVSLKLDTDNAYNGQFVNQSIWLGNDGQFAPMGVRQFGAFVEAATGEAPTGKLSLKAYEPVKKTNKKGEQEIHLAALEGLRVGVQLATATGNDGVVRTNVKAFMGELAATEALATDDGY